MASSGRSIINVAWRVLVIAIVYALVDRLLLLRSVPRPALTGGYLGAVAVSLVTGAAFALVLLPLARRLPYRFGTRFLALLLPLYWIGILSNLVEAAVDTTLPGSELAGAAVIFVIPAAVAAAMIAWLLPAPRPERPAPRILSILRERPLGSWAWRVALGGILFAGFVEVFGIAWGPLIARYYHGGQYAAQAHTVIAPWYVVWPEEWLRGVIFILVLLPLLAVLRGRGWRQLLWTAAYVALLNAVLESWLPMLSMTGFPLGFRIGEGLDLTTDAIVRGAFVAILLALPAAASEAGRLSERRVASGGTTVST